MLYKNNIKKYIKRSENIKHKLAQPKKTKL